MGLEREGCLSGVHIHLSHFLWSVLSCSFLHLRAPVSVGEVVWSENRAMRQLFASTLGFLSGCRDRLFRSFPPHLTINEGGRRKKCWNFQG